MEDKLKQVTKRLDRQKFIRIDEQKLSRIRIPLKVWSIVKANASGDMVYLAGFSGEARDGDNYLVLVSVDVTDEFGPLVHVSVSLESRYPAWDEIVELKQAIWGADLDAMMIVPKDEDYINLHANTFHLWSTPTEWGIQ